MFLSIEKFFRKTLSTPPSNLRSIKMALSDIKKNVPILLSLRNQREKLSAPLNRTKTKAVPVHMAWLTRSVWPVASFSWGEA